MHIIHTKNITNAAEGKIELKRSSIDCTQKVSDRVCPRTYPAARVYYISTFLSRPRQRLRNSPNYLQNMLNKKKKKTLLSHSNLCATRKQIF